MSTPNLHEPQWLERALTAGALYLGTLTSSLLKKSALQKRFSALEAKLEELAETVGGFSKGIYRRLGRLEAAANITPNPLGLTNEMDRTNHGLEVPPKP